MSVPPRPGSADPAAAGDAERGRRRAAKKRRRWLRYGLPAALVVALGIAAVLYVGWHTLHRPSTRAQIGDCLNIKEFKEGAEPVKIDCDDPSANTRVAIELDDLSEACPGVGYDVYSVTGGTSYKLCLMINAKQGDCFTGVLRGSRHYRRVPCADPVADVEFVKVAQGVFGTTACEGTEATQVLAYSRPPTTLCMKEMPRP